MRNVLTASALIICLNACQEEVEFSPVTTESRLVVNGSITTEYKVHTVRLSLSGPLAKGVSFQPVEGAEVMIMEGEENWAFLKETKPGVYSSDSIAAKVNALYTLEINWNGQVFLAQDSLKGIGSPINPIEFDSFGNFREIEFRRHLFGLNESSKEIAVVTPKELKTEIDTARAGLTTGVKLLPGGVYEFTSFGHPRIEVNGLLNFEDGKFFGFRTGARVFQRKFSLSGRYYQYLRSVFIETEWRGTLFDTPPANVNGNVSNGALGFFSAHDVASRQTVLQ